HQPLGEGQGRHQMRVLRVACAAAVLLSAWCLAGGRGSTADLHEVSWWWRGNTGPAPVPPPPTVPQGGLLVAGAPDGATAIAAVLGRLLGPELCVTGDHARRSLAGGRPGDQQPGRFHRG